MGPRSCGCVGDLAVDPLDDRGDPLADADAHRGQTVAPAGPASSWVSIVISRPPLIPSGWPRAIAPPLTLTLAGSRPSSSMHTSDWLAKASLSSTRSRSSTADPGPLEGLARRRNRPDPHDRRIDAGDGRRHDPGQWLEPELASPRRFDEEHRRRAVVDPRRVAGGDRPTVAEGGPQASQRLGASSRPAGARRGSRSTGSPFFWGTGIGTIWSSNRPASMAAIALPLRLEGERILPLAIDVPALGHVLGGLAHRVRVVRGGEPRVDEAPAERAVLELARPAVPGRVRLGHHVRRPGHRFDAAADEHVTVAHLDRVGGRVDRLEPAAAQPIDRLAGDLDREPGQQERPSGRRCGCPRRPGWRSRG